MTIDKEKAIQALAIIKREKQEQQERLRLAAQAKQQIESNSFSTTRL